MTTGINSAISSIRAVISILEKHSRAPNRHIDELNEQIQKIETGNTFTQKQALEHAGSMTHPKWLGDVYLENISWNDWTKALDKMNNKCVRAFNQLEKQ